MLEISYNSLLQVSMPGQSELFDSVSRDNSCLITSRIVERASCDLLDFAAELALSSFKSRKETVNEFPDWRYF